MMSNYVSPLPHPYLSEPRLYVSGLTQDVRKEDLAEILRFCTPYRPTLDGIGSGMIEFREIASAERALATLQNRPLPSPAPHCSIVLSPFPPSLPPTSLPPPQALPRLVKQLPPGITDEELYELFRPFGPLANVRSEAGFGPDIGVVEFWREEDAHQAEEAMHCAEVGHQNISVQVYQPRRAPGNHGDFSASAPPFVPLAQQQQQQQQQSPHQQGSMYSGHNQQNYSPPRNNLPPYSSRSPTGTPFQPGPGQQVQYAPNHGPGSSSHSGLIDPCNLFIKNLDAAIDSNDLFSHFRPYGQIVSARVMRTETGTSRGFGFVSYQAPDQAAAALNAMNNAMLGGKQIVVRLHEPKQLRQEKLANRNSTGRSPHPRSASGATSPTQSIGEGDLIQGGWTSPGVATPDRARRSSGSYYQAALSGTLNLPMRYEELSALSPVVRREVLTGELSRRLRSMPVDIVPPTEIDNIVDSLVSLGLNEVLEGIQNPETLSQQIRSARTADYLNEDEPQIIEAAPLPVSQATTPAPPASAPEHPSTPISIAASLSEPPRTSSPSGSLLATSGIILGGASEKDKLLSSVSRFEPDLSKAQNITDLLMTLSKKERAMCNFNVEFLKKKVVEAKEVLDADDDEESGLGVDTSAPSIVASTTPIIPSTPASSAALPPPLAEATAEDADAASESAAAAAPEVPDLDIKEAIAEHLVAPADPSTEETGDDKASVHTAITTTTTAAESVAPSHSVESLARMPAAEIVKLASSSNASTTSLPIPKADLAIVRETDAFIDGLEGMNIQQQKQAVGGRLWKVVKAFNVTKNVRSPVDGVYSAASFVTERLRFFY